MKRVIVDYLKLNDEILNLLADKFPDGYGIKDIVEFENAQGEIIQAVEVRTDDTVYLVKIGKRLIEAIEAFIDDNQDNDDDEQEDIDFDELYYDETDD